MTYVFNSSGQCTSATSAPSQFTLSHSHHEAKSTHTIVTQQIKELYADSVSSLTVVGT